jgi:hypothetical protein
VVDDHNVGACKAAVAITSSSPVSVYLNDVYHVLLPDVPVNVTTDVTGVLTMVQATRALSAACYHLQVQSVSAHINPMSKLQSTLSSVKSGDDLANVKVPNANGTRKPLVPSDVTSDQRNAVAQSLQQLVQVAGTMPQNGAVRSATEGGAAAAPKPAAAAAPGPSRASSTMIPRPAR